jgi:hypothetical protein
MISLVLTDKQAIALHMVYFLGVMLLAGDSAEAVGMMMANVLACLSENYSDAERDEFKVMMTNMGASVDPEVLRALHIKRAER